MASSLRAAAGAARSPAPGGRPWQPHDASAALHGSALSYDPLTHNWHLSGLASSLPPPAPAAVAAVAAGAAGAALTSPPASSFARIFGPPSAREHAGGGKRMMAAPAHAATGAAEGGASRGRAVAVPAPRASPLTGAFVDTTREAAAVRSELESAAQRCRRREAQEPPFIHASRARGDVLGGGGPAAGGPPPLLHTGKRFIMRAADAAVAAKAAAAE